MLIYKKDILEVGKVIVVEVVLSFEDKKVTESKHDLFEIFNKSSIPYILRLKKDEILITGNSSKIGNGIFKDHVFSKYQTVEPLSFRSDDPLVLKYGMISNKEEPKLLMEEGKYIPKHASAGNYLDAYSKAYTGLASSIGILTEEDPGSGIYSAAGSISSYQEQLLRETGMKIKEEAGKKANFIVSPEMFEQLVAEFSRQKDMYVEFSGLVGEDKQVKIEPMVHLEKEEYQSIETVKP